MSQIGGKRERRRFSRSPVGTSVPVVWDQENGQQKHLQGRLIDVSVSGAKIWLPIRLPARALLSFHCPKLALGGRGTVRYCNTTKGGYEVGLELNNGTGWRDQNDDLQNLAAGLERANQLAQQPKAVETVSAAAPKANRPPFVWSKPLSDILAKK